ncbi:MAG: methylated-DNA--[Treponema sp.]|nr:methylated-DNA--[protein]-cysteine S-methyltransferase [Treponema sp.]
MDFRAFNTSSYFTQYDSPVGRLLLFSDGSRLNALYFERCDNVTNVTSDGLTEKPLALFDETRRWLDIYFSGTAPDFTPPLAPIGTEFTKTVCDILLTIPYGTTTTYGAVAQQLRARGTQAAPQAVGGAIGRNPISIIIPCHRVIGHDGSMTGFGGGIERKIQLLQLEGVLLT